MIKHFSLYKTSRHKYPWSILATVQTHDGPKKHAYPLYADTFNIAKAIRLFEAEYNGTVDTITRMKDCLRCGEIVPHAEAMKKREITFAFVARYQGNGKTPLCDKCYDEMCGGRL